jgi:hypothetical protein
MVGRGYARSICPSSITWEYFFSDFFYPIFKFRNNSGIKWQTDLIEKFLV